ncbi:hypothetical protein PAXRUDRAFT_150361 [Paxillus rubicundulus Ve08.2h10]|uniref:Zn(2)-C6 fungal-type domain-containing protein n=1 Tax=Paxillus rubicundulus Ve08.2h10 TaxID=930991 RepID=A0A0D0DSG6_9AGAM|nr:hypothetical protein PAXRUDRAFT_177427 [Paxillus rubicundulus Ve08.2h10]KIK91066.1 hypothetical protein PAXRUDRAFT_150361 [Paxillus rubicundulus Ve08.2h10]
MEVVMPKGKGKKVSDRESTVTPFPPQGMVIHPDPCAKCVGSTVPCHGLLGHTCQKCTGLKVKCVHSQGRRTIGDQSGTVLRPIQAAAPMAGPSVRPQPSTASNDKEEVVIVVRAGKGKAASTWAKGVTVNEAEFKEVMWWLLICESKVWDAQA